MRVIEVGPDAQHFLELLEGRDRRNNRDLGLACSVTSPLPNETTLTQGGERVARRGVLIKDAAPGHALLRLGLQPRPQRRSMPLAFAWVPAL